MAADVAVRSRRALRARARRATPRSVRALRFLVLALVRQEHLIFRPVRTEMGSPADLGLRYEDLRLGAGGCDGLRAWWVPGAPGGKAVILFPGRRGNVTHELQTIRYLQRLGAGVLAVDYPGCGASEGRPTEAGCYAAARAAWQEVTGGRGFAPADVVLYGRSLGGAAATWLAAQTRCRGVVFHGGFSSLPGLASCFLPSWSVRLLCRASLDSQSRIAACASPLLVLHSRGDTLVPPALARPVFDAAPGPKRWVELDGGHHGSDWLYDPRVRSCWEALLSGAAQGWERALPT